MTKKVFILHIILITTMFTFGQIKITSNGNVGIGTNNPIKSFHVKGQSYFDDNVGICNSIAKYKLDVGNVVRFRPNFHIDTTAKGIIFGWNNKYYIPTIHSEVDNALWLGTPTSKLNHIWVWQLDYYGAITKVSDRKVKENIDSLSGILQKIRNINVCTYNYKDEYYKNCTKNQQNKRTEYGFIAQELKVIFPEFVYESENGLLSIDYISVVPVLTQAIKELQTRIETLEQQIGDIREDTDFKSMNLIKNEDTCNEYPILYQNTPNPFNFSTNIKLYIPDCAKNSNIYIYDMNGKQIKVFSIIKKGTSIIIIPNGELYPGMYIYTLIVDDKEVATKKMILTKE